MATKYLYLTRPEWSIPWVAGGRIPINPASTYLAMERQGIYTPDENFVYDAPFDVVAMTKGNYGFGTEVKNVKMIGCRMGDQVIPDVTFNHYVEDGLILSFCNQRSADICFRLRKKACVEISDIDELKRIIDNQLGVESRGGNCEYTDNHQRNHFLKSSQDSWQDEYRLFWHMDDHRRWVSLPPGIGRSIKMPKWVRTQ